MSSLPYKLSPQQPNDPTAACGTELSAEPNSLRFEGLEHPANGRLAQSVERGSYKAEVAGSCPAPPTKPSSNAEAIRSRSRREYLRNYGREWVRRRRAAFFDGKQCDKCWSAEDLELHHRDPKEKVAHSIWSWSEIRREVELAKCVVLCGDCHLKLTRIDFSNRHIASSLSSDSGISGIPNVSWNQQKGLWRVEFRSLDCRVSVGGAGFQNLVTARLTAESFRKTLAAHYAKKSVQAQIACRKQFALPLTSSATEATA